MTNYSWLILKGVQYFRGTVLQPKFSKLKAASQQERVKLWEWAFQLILQFECETHWVILTAWTDLSRIISKQLDVKEF